jgi:HAMP domain-containing protein
MKLRKGQLQRQHARWHRRHDFRLQRALFWWFGITICVTSCVSFGVMRVVSPDTHSWRKDAERLRQFAAGRFARVWDDAAARRELVQAVSQAFDVSLQVKDTQGHLLDSMGDACSSPAVTVDVERQGRALGTVQGCFRQERGFRWTAVLTTLLAAFLTIWAATAKLTRRLTRPLRDLTRVTREIGEGKLESRVRLNHHHKGEVGILAEG